MKRKIVTFFIIVICFLMQSSIFPRFTFISVVPNLFIILTSSYGFMCGKRYGMFVGLTCGIFADVFWGDALGFNMLLYMVIGYLNGSFRRLFYDEDIKLPIALISASELLYGVVTCFCSYILRGDFAFMEHLIHVILPELIYTILATLILYQIILYVNKKLEAEEQRSASKFV